MALLGLDSLLQVVDPHGHLREQKMVNSWPQGIQQVVGSGMLPALLVTALKL